MYVVSSACSQKLLQSPIHGYSASSGVDAYMRIDLIVEIALMPMSAVLKSGKLLWSGASPMP
jgi:hypothetical protein